MSFFRRRRGGDGPLGRHTPPDFVHVEKYPLTALAEEERPVDVPVVVGVNWYTAFDDPKELPDGSWHFPDVEKGEDLGSVRGGHCFALEPMGAVRKNRHATWKFYNQAKEGACVGFGTTRAQTIEVGPHYDGFWVYDQARKYEDRYPDGEGTYVRSGAKVLYKKGAPVQEGEVCERGGEDTKPTGPLIKAIRWATKVEEVWEALARPNAFAVPMVNSWGEDFPEVVWLPSATLQRLLDEEGEAGVYTEK